MKTPAILMIITLLIFSLSSGMSAFAHEPQLTPSEEIQMKIRCIKGHLFLIVLYGPNLTTTQIYVNANTTNPQPKRC